MFSSSSPLTDFSAFTSTGLTGVTGANWTGLEGLEGQTNPSGSFELMLAQLLLRLLERLEATDPAPASEAAVAGGDQSGAARFTFTSTQTNVTQLTWVYPGPAAGAVAAQAYGATSPVAAPVTPVTLPPVVTAPATPAVVATAPTAPTNGVMAIADFPHPPDDNGRGMHWIPTVGSSPEVVDRYIAEMKAMHIKWVPFLNDGASTGGNDYLVQQLKANGMEPVLRVYTPGLQPISGDLAAMVRHYKELGVSYFQLYNEPNHSVENDGAMPDVNRYLDLWIPAARIVAENGGLPGFGALSPGGEFKDTEFLAQALDGLSARGELGLLDHAWLSIHNYQGDRPVGDTEGFTRFQVYADVLQQKLGRLLPMVGTEGGTFTNGPADEPRRIQLVTDAYRYMANREPYNFAYSYWVIANQAGGGHDAAWEWQALIHPDGQSPLVNALQALA